MHEVAPPKYYLDLGLSYSPFSKVFACGLAHQQPSQMATRIVVINIGPCDRLIKCTHARASRVVERAPVMPVPPWWGIRKHKCHLVPEELFQARFTPVQTHGKANAFTTAVPDGPPHAWWTHHTYFRVWHRGVVADVSPWQSHPYITPCPCSPSAGGEPSPGRFSNSPFHRSRANSPAAAQQAGAC